MAKSITELRNRNGTSPIVSGILQAMPVVMGYIPIGFAFGVLAGQAHLSLISTLLMSLIVYAGSAQLIACTMFASGQPLWMIVSTTLIVNLRHLLFSAALAPALSRWNKWARLLFATELTDETFALHSMRFGVRVPDRAQVYATNMTSHFSWVLGSLLGYVAGSLLTDVKPYGLDYALSAMFVALLVLQIKNRTMVLVALVAAGVSVCLSLVGVNTWSLILATLVGATFGVVVERWTRK